MKVLLLNTYGNEGGAGKAVHRLHCSLIEAGIASNLLIQTGTAAGLSIVGPRNRLGAWLGRLRFHVDRLPLKLYSARKGFFSTAVVPDRISQIIRHLNPDVIHLNWVCGGFIRIETISELSRPVIWTIHDSWPFTGGCHIPGECLKYREQCGACPVLGSRLDNDLSRHIWTRKNLAWRKLRLTIVSPSHWLADCARSSSLFRNLRVEVIPNGVDTMQYTPIDKNYARKVLGWPEKCRIILAGSHGVLSDRNKGFHFLTQALAIYAKSYKLEDIELRVFGAGRPTGGFELDFRTEFVGVQSDESRLALMYSAADVFVIPSIQENLPNTAMEAMACGTPVLAFDTTGLKDLVQHLHTGYLAKPFDAADLANGLRWLLGSYSRQYELMHNARNRVKSYFDIHRTVSNYAELYRELLNG